MGTKSKIKLTDMTIEDWQQFVDEYKRSHKSDGKPLAFRIENTQFTIARHFGGAVCNGERYAYFEPRVPGHEPNPDGSPYVAWLLVRDSILGQARKWLKQRERNRPTEIGLFSGETK